MYITYHIEVSVREGVINMPIEVLHPDIVEFLSKHECLQSQYLVWSSGYNLFIYLNNGDRVDVQL